MNRISNMLTGLAEYVPPYYKILAQHGPIQGRRSWMMAEAQCKTEYPEPDCMLLAPKWLQPPDQEIPNGWNISHHGTTVARMIDQIRRGVLDPQRRLYVWPEGCQKWCFRYAVAATVSEAKAEKRSCERKEVLEKAIIVSVAHHPSNLVNDMLLPTRFLYTGHGQPEYLLRIRAVHQINPAYLDWVESVDQEIYKKAQELALQPPPSN